ncbi:TIGR03088 family PEP-CTERM/XrtA system glycosyltransferase [Rhodoferax antarcticus]|uniref:Glycosyltransferase group 1 protein n=1 Tax=Rhodoferax antarcticus ANT.BR TaxID=1111071 RepID=A0A1Q8YGV5_9BURK|nr:TIGR03088 family PEP-CTERM/XrtA system glycosyltransferase [Rhodoferax antarcticus]APW45078.1 sugar transferase [Rhodoferax antarcticus]OLP07294.1 glycosyltransferase group 1 protein [Rhodoferax antarcticus ANT.BR]
MTQHIVHVLYRFAAGGLENVIVQLVNGLQEAEFSHTVVALSTIDDTFSRRITRQDVRFIALNKPPGQPFRMYPTMYRLLRQLKPDVWHSCNLAALEFTPIAALAGVPLRVHAEHGWDVADPDGSNRHYQYLRKFYQRFVHKYVAVSEQLDSYLQQRIGLAPQRVHLFPNGVNTQCFRPWRAGDQLPTGYPFNRQEHWVVGTVGRLERIKNQPLLAQAFVRLVRSQPVGAERLRLAIVGTGPLETKVREIMQEAGLLDRLWLPGTRADVPEVLRALDCFVLPSRSEGTSCTLQEAMSTDLPLIATAVGGNPQLLNHGQRGQLVLSDDAPALAAAIARVWHTDATLPQPGTNRAFAEQHYSLEVMLAQYQTLFLGNPTHQTP